MSLADSKAKSEANNDTSQNLQKPLRNDRSCPIQTHDPPSSLSVKPTETEEAAKMKVAAPKISARSLKKVEDINENQ
ncbi:uncharacterized protein Z518_08570 [Rhinocladiella mackenziei CBS 650.93]|uniref:Uncharacterized protein n=1 Tax=Rhinocladiella mackenziei CBS 650.93 TaxID=1442369 RepID=A0A0D2GWM4_9EURO|nr:uncharacterized protein Z518_08570 [Rhinocladiella mackenziei CBS 650.93]KIX02628.1 hypothetical protein Z518_08570 [Rhinocladiella mackenziei CBS 650.93]